MGQRPLACSLGSRGRPLGGLLEAVLKPLTYVGGRFGASWGLLGASWGFLGAFSEKLKGASEPWGICFPSCASRQMRDNKTKQVAPNARLQANIKPVEPKHICSFAININTDEGINNVPYHCNWNLGLVISMDHQLVRCRPCAQAPHKSHSHSEQKYLG